MAFSKNFSGSACAIAFCFLLISSTSYGGTFKLFKKVACIKHKRKKSRRRFCATADNFYEVDKDTLYRSKQLTHKKLYHYIKKFGIKTVINLRGKNENSSWWQREKMVIALWCRGVRLYNIPMSAYRYPEEKHLNRLLHLYRTAKRPILIHCHGGADRTGEAAALWVLTQQNGSQKQALKQLTLQYGHIRWKAPLKRRFIKAFAARRRLQRKEKTREAS